MLLRLLLDFKENYLGYGLLLFDRDGINLQRLFGFDLSWRFVRETTIFYWQMLICLKGGIGI